MRPIQRQGMSVHKVPEMEVPVPLAMMIPDATTDDIEHLKRWYRMEDLSAPREDLLITLSLHSYVLKVGGQTILVDTCNGNDKTRSVPFADHLQTDYLKHLVAAGVTPEDVDVVMCTHLHCDHVGWNTKLEDGRWVPTFPNARYVFSKADYEHFVQEDAEPLHREAFVDSVLPIVEAGRADLVEQSHVLMQDIGDGVWIEDAAGHSPGCVLLRAGKGDEQFVFSGDVFHHPIQLVRPQLASFADFDPVKASAVRQRLCEEVTGTPTIVLPAHFCGASAGMIRTDGSGYKFEFVDG